VTLWGKHQHVIVADAFGGNLPRSPDDCFKLELCSEGTQRTRAEHDGRSEQHDSIYHVGGEQRCSERRTALDQQRLHALRLQRPHRAAQVGPHDINAKRAEFDSVAFVRRFRKHEYGRLGDTQGEFGVQW
jgi:hypothetical protein